ncbi:hypothetical protein FRUB_09835 [Fimbriiglobus ruber]|uniref:DUF1501 domain-containing protein n=2 Tax=Fimbriiglobus ruber TaxID=1908690 RepID=A0A225D230_9BACT|nr:hypothetical protein FRUB_09835 [Fimbriiglobus ruber]
MASLGASGWLPALAADAARNPSRKRSCIVLWMNGGPSTIDLFDLKPGHKNGGPLKEIATNVPGLRVSELLPKVARLADHLAVIRSMSTKEGDHGRAAFIMRTGNLPLGAIQFPGFGALVAKELDDPAADLPGYVRICPPLRERAFGLGTGAGFLGPRYTPLAIGESDRADVSAADLLRVPNLERAAGVNGAEYAERLDLLAEVDRVFATDRAGELPGAHRGAAERAERLMRPDAARAFQLDDEPAAARDRYGRTPFGQGCLLARRLVERGVPFVEVGLDGWDTHNQNFDALHRLTPALDSGWSSLLLDLKDRGLLATTTVVWAGEFGRTPSINTGNGRDHYPKAWSTVIAGGGVKGGLAAGRTSADGTEVEERAVSVPDFLATICRALGIDPLKQNLSNVGRPIRIVDKSARAVEEVLA